MTWLPAQMMRWLSSWGDPRTLFTSQNVSKLTGVLLPEVNDTWVFRLLLEKVEVKTPQEQGADITVTWHPSGTPDLSTS